MERLWALGDEITAFQTVTYNTQEICDQFAEFVRAFPTITDGERDRAKLLVTSFGDRSRLIACQRAPTTLLGALS